MHKEHKGKALLLGALVSFMLFVVAILCGEFRGLVHRNSSYAVLLIYAPGRRASGE